MSDRARLQIEVTPDEQQAIDDALPKVRARSRVDLVRRAVEVYLELLAIREQDGEVMLVRKDGVRERVRL